jgi:small-conductance mechanosensitive channel
MFCSACGNADQRLGAFCTRCGARQSETGADDKRETTPNERLRITSTFSLANALMAAFAALLLYYFHWGETAHWSIYVAAALCTVIAGHQAVSFYNNWQLRRRLAQAQERTHETGPLNAAPDAHALPPADTSRLVKPPASVTEHTTQLLEPVPRKKP